MNVATKSAEFTFIEALASEMSSKQLIFPTSLNATMKIRHALNDQNASTEKVARIVGMESVLSAQLLRMANSATFNPRGSLTTDLRGAITRLGFSMVRNLAISIGMKQLTQCGQHRDQPTIEGLWKRSIRVGALAYVITKKCSRLNPDTAMLVGLLHDIGKFYILYRACDFSEIFFDEPALWSVVDRWHANIGEAILQSWEIPDEICAAARDHRDLGRVHFGPPDLTDLIIAADFLDAHFYSETMKELNWNQAPHALINLDLTKERCEALMEEVEHELVEIFRVLG